MIHKISLFPPANKIAMTVMGSKAAQPPKIVLPFLSLAVFVDGCIVVASMLLFVS
jgi:hypothetical protein